MDGIDGKIDTVEENIELNRALLMDVAKASVKDKLIYRLNFLINVGAGENFLGSLRFSFSFLNHVFVRISFSAFVFARTLLAGARKKNISRYLRKFQILK